MGTLESILAEHPFLEGLDPPHLEVIAGCASNVRFNKGDYIFREEDEADRFFLIRHGLVALDVFVPQRGPVTIDTIQEGDVLGWSWLFPPYSWHFDARALQLTRAVAFDGKCLREKCDKDVQLGYELVKRFAQVIMQRLQSARLQLLDIYGDAKGR
ncbi:MAG: cyclic nucleotide-binding domain-containing protein [Candidatus Latescibacterota bacterium]|nr:MAG: cyclic nucleotide-binding domain-containing protein [Candidatus Latescibacterota bacterium]